MVALSLMNEKENKTKMRSDISLGSTHTHDSLPAASKTERLASVNFSRKSLEPQFGCEISFAVQTIFVIQGVALSMI